MCLDVFTDKSQIKSGCQFNYSVFRKTKQTNKKKQETSTTKRDKQDIQKQGEF